MQTSKMSLIFHESVMGRSSFVFVIVYTMTSQVISDRGCELSKYGVPNIFPEFLIRLTLKLNISKNSEPK